MKIAYLTAGAAGMVCGSCLHDNTLAKELIQQGHDAILIPTYTPIMTDEASVSSDKLFYGGLNVYLQQVFPPFRWLPNWADQFLSSPKLVGWVASRAMGTSAGNLGALTVSMLKGRDGFQRREVQRLCAWLKTQAPEVVVFSNLLIAGCLSELKRQIGVPVVVILQGDDIFYDGLPEPYRTRALVELRKLAQQVDLFIVHSRDYGLRMQTMLGFSDHSWAVSPLSIDTRDFRTLSFAADRSSRPPTIGYLARLAPEKGLHLLVDAFIALQSNSINGNSISDEATLDDTQLAIAGWLGKHQESYWQEQLDKLSAAGLDQRVRYYGSVDRAGKLAFLAAIDVLCVPTTYLEPKGLFVLEGLAAGVPYLQPAHGAFPEMHARLGGGLLFDPQNPHALAERLREMLNDRAGLRALGESGRQSVFQRASIDHEARNFVTLLKERLQV